MNPLVIDFRWDQADSLGVVTTNETAKPSGAEDGLEIASLRPGALQQNADAGPHRAAT